MAGFHDYMGTEHILLGLIREGEGVAAQVLVKLGADLSRVRQAKRYKGLATLDFAAAMVVPGNGKVYLTGRTGGSDVDADTAADYATIAYSTTTGAQQWVQRYNGPSTAPTPPPRSPPPPAGHRCS